MQFYLQVHEDRDLTGRGDRAGTSVQKQGTEEAEGGHSYLEKHLRVDAPLHTQIGCWLWNGGAKVLPFPGPSAFRREQVSAKEKDPGHDMVWGRSETHSTPRGMWRESGASLQGWRTPGFGRRWPQKPG